MKKFLSIFLTAVLIAQLTFAFSVLPVKAKAEADNKCGDNITWIVDTISGVLTLSGTGKTYEYDIGSAPWDKYADYITSIVVSEGITHIQEGTLNKLTKAVSLTLPSTIEEIRTTAAMPSLENIIIAEKTDLYYVMTSFADESLWYHNHADGSLIYYGSFLFGVKGDFSESVTTLEIAEGTTAVGTRAFVSQSQITDITFPDSLKYIGNSAFYGTGWFNNQPDGLVYAGNVALKWKGLMSDEQTDVVLKEGTKGIAEHAFSVENSIYNNDKITSITIPATVEEIGDSAFWGCDDLIKVVFEPGCSLRKIHDSAFYQCDMTSFEIPETVVKIGDGAFSSTNLTGIYIPSGVLMIDGAFISAGMIKEFKVAEDNPNYCSDSKGVLFNKDKTILHFYPGGNRREEYTVPAGVLYIADGAFAASKLRSLTFNDELQATGIALFSNSYITKLDFGSGLGVLRYQMFMNTNLKSFVIPSSIKLIEHRALDISTFTDIYFLNEDVVFGGNSVYSPNRKVVFHCYTNSTAHKHAEEYGINYVLFDDEHYTVEIDKLLTKAEGIYRPNYTDESLADLDAVLNKIDLNAEGLTQYQIDDWCVELEAAIDNLKLKSDAYSEIDSLIEQVEAIDRSLYTDESLADLDDAINAVDRNVSDSETIEAYAEAIEAAISNLTYKPADFSELNDILETVNSLDRSLYTAESLAVLDETVAAVDYDLTIDKQAQAAEWAEAIEAAIENLEYLPADYFAVEAAIEKANALDKRYYSELSLIALDAAINAVDYSLNITEQAKVDVYAQAIADAISALEYAPIVLRHEPCGVVVSATTKEIKPDTMLTVEEVDSSEYEGTNFAVGGSIRSLHFYDINLVYEAVVVQPDGTVTVKIKLADGVDPAKCKVYHVTEDIVNPLVRFASTIDGNYIVFETDHFSEFAVIEVETVVESVEVAELPDTTVYGIGEQLDLSGIKVVAHYSDGTSKEIADYSVGMITLNTVGTQKVKVYYTYGNITKTVEFEITVSAEKCSADITENGKFVDRVNKKLGLFAFYTRASIQLDCNVQNADGCTLRWSSNNSKVLVDENGKVTCKGLFGAKKANITVEVIDGNGNVVARDTVFVIFYKLSFQLSNTASQAFNIFKRSFILW